MTKTPFLIRQGDIVLQKVSKLPQRMVKRDTLTVARGEITGHSHRFAEGDAKKVSLLTPEGAAEPQAVRVKERVDLVHEDHKPLSVPKGTYLILREREHDPFAEEVRQVVD